MHKLIFLCLLFGCTTLPQQQPHQIIIVDDTPHILELMNNERKKVGAAPLSIDAKLTCAASRHSKDIGTRKICTHTGVDRSTPWQRANLCGTKANGEIVACGQKSAKEAVIAWMKSNPHKNIMLTKNYTKVGIAMHNNYWTAIFSY